MVYFRTSNLVADLNVQNMIKSKHNKKNLIVSALGGGRWDETFQGLSGAIADLATLESRDHELGSIREVAIAS